MKCLVCTLSVRYNGRLENHPIKQILIICKTKSTFAKIETVDRIIWTMASVLHSLYKNITYSLYTCQKETCTLAWECKPSNKI